jgi:DNA primase small subunit
MMPTIAYLQRLFSEYYSRAEIIVPKRFGRREWGFFFLQGHGMVRHLSFNRIDELRGFLSDRSPKHVYYSSAYYQQPDLQPMQRKVEGWLGADLIFDLDDEHLSGTEGLTLAQRLEKVKRIVKDKLLDDFLLGDFGFDPELIRVTFSGGRGYHIHVFDPAVLTFESPERREIVDYITGLGLDYDRIFTKQVYDVKSYGPHRVAKRSMNKLPLESDGGWRGRIARGIMKLLDEMENIDENECIGLLQSIPYNGKPVSTSSAKRIYDLLFEGKIGDRRIDTIRQEKIIDIIYPDKYRDIFLNIVRYKAGVEMAGETDEPVTVDTRRLIRFPGSLHGKTGLRVVTIPLDEINDFNPLKDAVVFDEISIKVKLSDDVDFELGDDHFTLTAGTHDLPKYAAVYLMCRGAAQIV